MSIKQRLLWLVLSVITLIWLGATVFTYYDARHELNEMLDAHLAQAATLLVVQFADELDDFDEDDIDTDSMATPHKYSRSVAFQVWDHGRRLVLRSANAPLTALASRQAGFSQTEREGNEWRVFSTWDREGEVLIHVAEQVSVRRELARAMTRNLLLPLLLALPLLAGLIWLAVALGLRPLARLTHSLARRDPHNLSALDTRVPQEVRPMIERLNHLFARIQALIENERRFTADAAHELRTPVAAIKAQLQVAQGAEHRVQQAQAIHNALLGTDKAVHLIEQLLTLARLESVDAAAMQPCALRALATDVIADQAPIALQSAVRMQLLPGAEQVVSGLPVLLTVLLRNLLDNAVRYSPAHTEVSVAVTRIDGRAVLWIEDQGRGLSPADRERVCQRFYRVLGTDTDGSGLGLSIVQRIVAIHQAELRLEAGSGGRGLRVSVAFPARL